MRPKMQFLTKRHAWKTVFPEASSEQRRAEPEGSAEGGVVEALGSQ
jgi:hypothetical protein